ncbi:hypothetical protein BH10PSE18_BH10PSE18_08190 [soil metagenome]
MKPPEIPDHEDAADMDATIAAMVLPGVRDDFAAQRADALAAKDLPAAIKATKGFIATRDKLRASKTSYRERHQAILSKQVPQA